MTGAGAPLVNGGRIARAGVPVLAWPRFEQAVLDGVAGGGRVVAWFGVEGGGGVQVVAVLADPGLGMLEVLAAAAPSPLPSLTPRCPQVHLFERELAEQLGLAVAGHPGLAPIRYHRSSAPGRDAWGRSPEAAIEPSVRPFFAVAGDAVHEVAVGPVHAGVIEPGHFRFNCHGERVLTLEISLGYQHRGVERAMVEGPGSRTVHLMETVAGDSSVAHATAHAMAVEALTGVAVPHRAEVLRAIALELERIANHVGDLGALAGDIGFLPTSAFCGRLRGDVLNLSALVCGSRFGRGMVRPGGVRFDLEPERADELRDRLDVVFEDIRGAVELMFGEPSVQARFEGTGVVTAAQAEEIGLVGPAARACGLERDARLELPWGLYRFAQLPVSTWASGDVFARASVRWLEVQRSVAFIREQTALLRGGASCAPPARGMAPDALAVTLVEGWRGEICHVALTGGDGRFARYKLVDPSFHNWSGLELALRGGEISDFPLCNKSFNLSYCGHDL